MLPDGLKLQLQCTGVAVAPPNGTCVRNLDSHPRNPDLGYMNDIASLATSAKVVRLSLKTPHDNGRRQYTCFSCAKKLEAKVGQFAYIPYQAP